METETKRRTHRATQPIEAATNRAALLRLQTVGNLAGMQRSAIYQRIKNGTFPAPLKLSARCARWRAGDVLDWLESVGGRSK